MIVRHHYSRELIDAARAGNPDGLIAECRENTKKVWETLGVAKDKYLMVKTRKTYPGPRGGIIVETEVVACDDEVPPHLLPGPMTFFPFS